MGWRTPLRMPSGARFDLAQVGEWAREDAAITHPNPVGLQANALYVMAIAHAIKTGAGALGVFRPRPECFWPVDVLELAERLVG